MIRIWMIALFLFFNTYVLLAQPITKLDCATNQFAPFGMIEQGQLIGIEVEVFQEIGKRLNIEINLKLLPWKKMISFMKKGKLDCMFAAFKTEERLQFMDYTNVPFHISKLVFYVHKDKPYPYQSLKDLKGRTIGLVRGFKTSPGFDEVRTNKWFSIEEANGVEQNFKKLNKKKIDMVLFNHYVGAYTLKNLGIKKVMSLPIPLTATAAYITFSKKRNLSQWVPKFDAVLFNILTDGTYKSIFEKYISSSN